MLNHAPKGGGAKEGNAKMHTVKFALIHENNTKEFMPTLRRKNRESVLFRLLPAIAAIVITSLLGALTLGTSAAFAASDNRESGVAAIRVESAGDGFATLTTSVGEFLQKEDGSISVTDEAGSELFPVHATGILDDGSTTSDVSYSIVGDALEVTWSTSQTHLESAQKSAGLTWNCVLQYLGLVAGTVGVIVATGGTATVFIFGLGTYVINIASVVQGC